MIACITPEKCDILVQEFIQVLKQFEGKSSIIYSKTSFDKKETFGCREWTVCILFDPKKSPHVDSNMIRKPLFSSSPSHYQSYGEEQQHLNLKTSKQVKLTYTESQLLTDPLQQVLSKWAFKFVERFGQFCLR